MVDGHVFSVSRGALIFPQRIACSLQGEGDEKHTYFIQNDVSKEGIIRVQFLIGGSDRKLVTFFKKIQVMRGSEGNTLRQKYNLFRICLTILLVHVSSWRCNFHADAFIKCMESPRTRVVVQPCQRVVCHTIEKVVTMIPNRNDLSEERLGMKILQQLRSPDSARTEKKVKTDAIFIQVRFPQIDFTSNLAHRKHTFSPTHPHPHKKTSWLYPKPLSLAPSVEPELPAVGQKFAEIFFRPSVAAHKVYCGDRISRSLTWNDLTGNSESLKEAFHEKACKFLK